MSSLYFILSFFLASAFAQCGEPGRVKGKQVAKAKKIQDACACQKFCTEHKIFMFQTKGLCRCYSGGKVVANDEADNKSYISGMVTPAHEKWFKIDSKVVGQEVDVRVRLPYGWDMEKDKGAAVVFWLHGGGSTCDEIDAFSSTPLFDDVMDYVDISRVVIACPNVPMSPYAPPWDTFFHEEFPAWLNEKYGTRLTGNALTGSCMGGFGSLMVGLLEPEKYVAIGATQPGLYAGFQEEDAHSARIIAPMAGGVPFFPGDTLDDFLWWNPANITVRNEQRIKDSGIELHVNVGDEDELVFQDGVQFLTRLWYDLDIRFEMYQQRWSGHVDRGHYERYTKALTFVLDALNGGKAPDRDESALTQGDRDWLAWSLNPQGPPPEAINPFETDRVSAYLKAMSKVMYAAYMKDDPEGFARNYGVIPSTGVYEEECDKEG